jgi:hypothetical protein
MYPAYRFTYRFAITGENLTGLEREGHLVGISWI